MAEIPTTIDPGSIWQCGHQVRYVHRKIKGVIPGGAIFGVECELQQLWTCIQGPDAGKTEWRDLPHYYEEGVER